MNDATKDNNNYFEIAVHVFKAMHWQSLLVTSRISLILKSDQLPLSPNNISVHCKADM